MAYKIRTHRGCIKDGNSPGLVRVDGSFGEFSPYAVGVDLWESNYGPVVILIGDTGESFSVGCLLGVFTEFNFLRFECPC